MSNLSSQFARRECRAIVLASALVVLIEHFDLERGIAQQKVVLTDVTDDTGISFQHTDGSSGKYFLIEPMSAGLALLDFDLDGDLDIYFLNGTAIGNPATPDGPKNALYRNDGDFHFTEVTDQAGVGDPHMGLGIACADYDNDGWTDIYLNNYGENILYHNNGDGSFDAAIVSESFRAENKVGSGASFFDMDLDGDLDLYSSKYIQFDPATHATHYLKGLPAYPSPMRTEPEPDMLFKNDGAGHFNDVSDIAGIQQVSGRGMGVVTFDYDGDQDIDIYVANDQQGNYLFENDGNGQFSESGLLTGLAVDGRGNPQASMGIELIDYNNDGLLDVYVTSFSREFDCLYRNEGHGQFTDVTLSAGAANVAFPHVTWGLVVADFDCDGFSDLLIATGGLDPLHDQRGGRSDAGAYRACNILLCGTPQGKLEAQADWGSASLIAESTRGMVAGDLDNDGRIDVVAMNSRARPTIMRNDSLAGNHVFVRLIGTRSNRDALGAKIALTLDTSRKLVRERKSGYSYQSDFSGSEHFGIGSCERQHCKIEVTWPSGFKTTKNGSELWSADTVRIVESAAPPPH